VLVQDLMKEVETELIERPPRAGYESKSHWLWRWASKTRGSMWKRLAFHLSRKTYKEWDRAEWCFSQGLTYEFWPILNQAASYENAYALLEDDASRDVFAWRLKVRLVMPFVLKWEDVFPAPPAPGVGDLSIGKEEEVFCKDFKSGQYLLRDICIPEHGDIVLDLGAYVGDSAVSFSRLVGPTGHIYSFEALKSQFETLKQNLTKFKCDNVTPCFNAAWNKSEELMMSSARGSSCIGCGEHPVQGIRVDDFVRERSIEQVDFIKMDIEGAEPEALEGCSETIKKFKPKLALSAYHKPEDLYLLIEIVKALDPGYRFYMRHYDSGFCDTVLYAVQ